MPDLNEKFSVPAADNDPCFAGSAEAVILVAPEEQSCSFADKTHFWQQVSITRDLVGGLTVIGCSALLCLRKRHCSRVVVLSQGLAVIAGWKPQVYVSRWPEP
jgi:hypothetical protein